MTSEPPHIMRTETIMAKRRPCVSASRPKSQPPKGRMRNPAAKTPAAFRSCVVRSPDGKKAGAQQQTAGPFIMVVKPGLADDLVALCAAIREGGGRGPSAARPGRVHPSG